MNRLFVFLTAFLLSASSLEAQGQSQQDTSGQATPPTVRSTAQEVVLDMVFRDKKGRTIRNIRPEEIHVSEDGVEQKLTAFRVVDGKTAASLTVHISSVTGGLNHMDSIRYICSRTL